MQAQEAVLGEIVVTARKTAERLQDVPLAITALDSQAILDAGIGNLDDIANQTPGLIFFSAFGDDLPTPVIRGISQTQIFGENNVAIFVDGAYVSGRAGINFAQLDLERIEVVKGPQSAMYGRGSFSGAINFITAKPTREAFGRAEATLGDSGTERFRLVGSGLLTDQILGRIALSYDSWDGSYENQNPGGGPNIGGYDRKTLDGSLLFEPSDSLSILLKAYLSDDQNYSPAISTVFANCEPRTTDGKLANVCGELQPVGTRDLSVVQTAYGQLREITRANLNIDWDVAGGTLSAITGYSDVTSEARYDGSRGGGDRSIPFLYQTNAVSNFAPNAAQQVRAFYTGLVQDDPEDSTTEISQEVRFTSDASQSLRWGAGGYYWEADTEARGNRPFATVPLPGDFRDFLPVVRIPLPPTFTTWLPVARVGNLALLPWWGETQPITTSFDETKSWSLFAHVEKDLSETTTVRLEGRFSDEENIFTATTGASASDSWSFGTGRASVTWKPSDEATYYAAVSRGVKAGGFDTYNVTVNGAQVTEFSPYDPEKLWSYEAGMKRSLWDGRAYLDVSVFFLDWTDIIIPTVFDPDGDEGPSAPVGVDDNAGSAHSQGIEAQLSVALTDALTLGLGGTWNEAEYDDAQIESFFAFPSFAPDGDVSGNQLLRQSKIQANASLAYRSTLSNGWDLFWRVDANYRSKWYVGADNLSEVPARTISNLRFGIESDTYRLEFWGDNVLDEDAPTAAFRDVWFSNTPDGVNYNFFPFRYSVSHPDRRRFGVTATVKF